MATAMAGHISALVQEMDGDGVAAIFNRGHVPEAYLLGLSEKLKAIEQPTGEALDHGGTDPIESVWSEMRNKGLKYGVAMVSSGDLKAEFVAFFGMFDGAAAIRDYVSDGKEWPTLGEEDDGSKASTLRQVLSYSANKGARLSVIEQLITGDAALIIIGSEDQEKEVAKAIYDALEPFHRKDGEKWLISIDSHISKLFETVEDHDYASAVANLGEVIHIVVMNNKSRLVVRDALASYEIPGL